MKITENIIKTTINQFESFTTNIDIATHTAGNNKVNLMYNTNYKVYTIKTNGVEYYASNRGQAIQIFYRELYLIN